MAQCLRMYPALAEDLNSVLNTHGGWLTATCIPSCTEI